MIDSDDAFVKPVVEERGVRELALAKHFERRGFSSERSIGLIFKCPDFESEFVNATGRKILTPSFGNGELSHEFKLRDIIGVESKRIFEGNLFPLLQVGGGWSGDLVLRDLCGGDFSAHVTFWRDAWGEGQSKEFLFMCGEPLKHSSFRTMRGWRDRELLLALLGNTNDAVYFKDRESRFLRASDSLTKRFGLKYPYEVIGKTDFHFYGISHAAPAFEDEQEIIRTGEPIVDKVEREVWDDQSVTWASTTKLPLYDASGKIVGTFGISRDITARKVEDEERKHLEQRLLLAHKLEAIGSLAAGVAHEINTPTQFVSDNVKFLGDAFADIGKVIAGCLAFVEKSKGIQELDVERAALLEVIEECDLEFLNEEIPQTIEQTLEGLRQTAQIVASMKEFSYPSSPDKSKADLNRVVENTLNVSRNEWKGVAELTLELDPNLPEVSCMVDQINQVVLNLIVNAAHAIGSTESRLGRLTLRTKVDGKWACIEVADTGTGMDEAVRARIFEPFFTTKEVGRGTGQGLSMVRNIVVNTHGGEIECETELGVGTLFRVRLPLDC